MRLLMLSWRYLGHPQAGGAEVMTHEVLRRLVDRGWNVACFTAAHHGGSEHDARDGVRLIRRGRQWTVHAHAYQWLRSRLDEYDRVIDQTNTISFFTPLYVPRAKRRLFVHQLAREYWFRETRGALKVVSPLGYALEPLQLRLYRSTRAVAVSPSTRDDLRRHGVRDVSVVPMGVSMTPTPELTDRTGPLRVVVIGRLTPAKFVEEGLTVFERVQRRYPDAQLDVVGKGDAEYRARLEALVRELGLRGVTFHGRVDHERKRDLLQRAHVHLFTSHREGWGLTVSEAAAVGTPSVGYDAPGVRDSIAESRLLAPIGDVVALADRLLAFVSAAPAERDHVRRAAWERAKSMSWDRTADAFQEAVS